MSIGRLLIALPVVLSAACLDAFAPRTGPIIARDLDAGANPGDGGNPGDGAAACAGDSDPTTMISFQADLAQGVFSDYGCINCHSSGGEGLSRSGLNLTSYANLRLGGSRSVDKIVVPFNPCESILALKIGPDFAVFGGSRMPKDRSPLSSTEIMLVRDWIAEGASDN